MKRQSKTQKNIFAKHISEKDVYPEYVKEVLQ